MVGEQGPGDVSVPPTIQALLAARIDQLPRSEREALERGAVEGQVFHRGAVQALAPENPTIGHPPAWGSCARSSCGRARPCCPDDDAFRFRHLLIRDAAYEALPKATRADLHERFADWIAERGADLVELDEILGYHLEQAARYRSELGTAVRRASGATGVVVASVPPGRARSNAPTSTPPPNLLGRGHDSARVGRPGARAAAGLRSPKRCTAAGTFERGDLLLQQAVDAAERRSGRRGARHGPASSPRYIQGHMGRAPMADVLRRARRDPGRCRRAPTTSCSRVRYLARAWFLYWLGQGRRRDRRRPACARACRARRAPGARGRGRRHGRRGDALGPDPVAGARAVHRRAPRRRRRPSRRQAAARRSATTGRLPSPRAVTSTLARGAVRGDAVRYLAERGGEMFLHRLAMDIAFVELRAGQAAAAASMLEEAWHGLGEEGEHGFRSTIGTMLAEVLARLGRVDEANALIDESERLAAEDDAATMIGVARARALVAAARGTPRRGGRARHQGGARSRTAPTTSRSPPIST